MKAIVLTCPLCSRKLRIAEDLLGQDVLCPTCAGTFTAPATDVPPTSAAANEEEPAHALAIIPRQIIPPVPAAKVRLVGEEEGKPYHSDSPRPSSEDADLGLRLCPASKRPARHSVRYCPHCGEYLSDEENDAPWPYRDCEPHRAGLILGLGIISIVLATTCVFSVIGLPVGIAALIMARRDLALMAAGRMDPEGRVTTHSGYACGIVGTILNGPMVIFLGLSLLSKIQF